MRLGKRVKLGLRMGTGLRNNDQPFWITQDFPNFKPKSPHPRKSFIPRQTRIVGHPKIKTNLSLGRGMESSLGLG